MVMPRNLGRKDVPVYLVVQLELLHTDSRVVSTEFAPPLLRRRTVRARNLPNQLVPLETREAIAKSGCSLRQPSRCPISASGRAR